MQALSYSSCLVNIKSKGSGLLSGSLQTASHSLINHVNVIAHIVAIFQFSV